MAISDGVNISEGLVSHELTAYLPIINLFLMSYGHIIKRM